VQFESTPIFCHSDEEPSDKEESAFFWRLLWRCPRTADSSSALTRIVGM